MRWRLGALLITLGLTACSGGGGGGGNTATPNLAPLAEAGASVSVTPGDVVVLDGSGSNDPDGTIAAWQWEQLQGPTAVLEAPDSPQSGFVAPDVNTDAELVFSLTVTDNEGASASDTMTVSIRPANPVPAYRISGRLATSASQAVDSDTNNPDSRSRDNNTPETAQSISNPITLGGHLNRSGAGEPGNSQENGDEDDFFRIDLLADQAVTMLVADYENADADLYLYDTDGNIVDFSIETGELESITIPVSGTYLVNASIFSGATNYILAVGNEGVETRDKREIIPWQAYVAFRDPSIREPGGPDLSMEDLAESVGMVRQAGARNRGTLMRLRENGLMPQQYRQRLQAAAGKKDAITDPEQRNRWETLMTIKSLRGDPRIAYAEPNYQLRTLQEPNDPAYVFQWHLPLINLPAAWETTTGAADVVVAVVDSGVLPAHPDLTGQLLGGYDFVRDPVSAQDGDGIDPDPTDPGGSDPGSSSFHGTHVSGTIAASGNNRAGVAGVAYSARIMPLRALGSGGAGTSYDVRQAIRYAAGLPNDSGLLPQQPADIINLSLGGAGFSRADQDLFQALWQSGITVVAAAGNEASTLPSYPAAYDHVISVSAVDAQRQITSYSNTGPTVDVAAPGGDNGVDLNGDGYPDGVLSTGATQSAADTRFAYTFLSGTSMAAPHVAGVIALMKSVNPDLGADDIETLLTLGELSDELGAPGRDDLYGYGLINARRAVNAALSAAGQSPSESPRLVASAQTLSFARSATGLRLDLSNAGSGDLTVQSVSADRDWVQVTAAGVGPQGLGNYLVTVDRETLPTGTYDANIIAESSANTVTIKVLMTVAAPGAATGIGVTYVLLYDVDTDEPVAQFIAAGDAGRYRFNFSNVPAGRYYLYAGTDSDNDLFICDEGEACGAWLNLDQPIVVELDSNLEDLEFPVEFQVAIPTLQARTTPPRRTPEKGLPLMR